ncbi:mucin-5AC-like isoform X2 [Carassius gibelio]|uniref:mucin-5AC-like isoform X2 n=1 Tax=Carassius gibelio TaxID=101364 RepID=UPI002277D7ED|nr:mucin-5AC-like isoform X2 [Carassius gibelio]
MEWRIIVPGLCLIGILLVPGNAAQNITDISNSTSGNLTTNQPAPSNQNATTNLTASTNQPAPSNQNATTNLTASTNQPASTNQTTNTTSSFNQTTTPATTVSTPAATVSSAPNTASLNLVFSLTQTFKPVFSDLNAPETQQLILEITNTFTPIYKKRFPNLNRMIIQGFRSGSVVTDSVLEFNTTAGTAPNVTDVKDTFISAVNSGNLNFTVDNTSVRVADIKPTSAPTTVSTTNQPGSTNQNATANQTASTNQPGSTNQNATANQTASTNQPGSTNQNATANQTASTNQPGSTNQNATANQTASTNQTPNTTSSFNQTTTPATTVSTPAATVSSAPNTASLNLVFRLTQTFKPVFSNLNAPETQQLILEITNTFTPIYRNRFKNFRRMIIQGFRSGSVVTDSVLEFNTTSSTTPNVTDVKDTFISAVNSGNLNFTVDNTSVSVADITPTSAPTTVSTTNQPASTNQNATSSQTASTNQTTNTTSSFNQTTTPATTVSTPAATVSSAPNTASLNLVFRLTQTFKPVFSDLNAPETQQLILEITNTFTPIYKKRFPNFLRMIIRSFRNGSVVTDSVLEFNTTAGTAPNMTDVKDTFISAVNSGNLNFTVDNTSVSVADITPTSAPTTVSTTADSGRSEFNMTFKMNEVFTNELSNISSPQAVTLAKNITTQFDGVLKKRFSNYVDMKIWRFRSGSVIVDSLLGFNKTSTAPTATELVNLIVESARNGSFTFTVSSLSVTDSTGNTVNRSPVLASMLTALWMTLASLVVSAVMH